VFALPDVLDFFAHKFTRLRGRRLALPRIFASPLDGFFLWHFISSVRRRSGVLN
jgi:hypothetical protein